MRIIVLIVIALAHCTASVGPAFAHGDEPHPKCKKGYVVSDAHKCVKAPG